MSLTNNSYADLISSVEERLLAGETIERSEAAVLVEVPDEFLTHLTAAADRVRIHFRGGEFDACSLINARSGRCSEDCAFCAQSARYDTDCVTYGLRSTPEIVSAAKEALEFGASRFCTVTSGGALSDRDFDALMGSLEQVAAEVDIALDVSLGFLTEQRAERLAAAGVTRYNHNLETSRDHFSRVCTTHTFDHRVDTVRRALSSGFSACSGGIIGMGETASQRLDLAFSLAELGVDCVPINILDPRPGTPLQDMATPGPLEILRTIAVFRLILPRSTLKIAGGRERNLGDFQGMALRSGANGMIVGGYLTTSGRSLDVDLKMIRDAGFQLERVGASHGRSILPGN